MKCKHFVENVVSLFSWKCFASMFKLMNKSSFPALPLLIPFNIFLILLVRYLRDSVALDSQGLQRHAWRAFSRQQPGRRVLPRHSQSSFAFHVWKSVVRWCECLGIHPQGFKQRSPCKIWHNIHNVGCNGLVCWVVSITVVVLALATLAESLDQRAALLPWNALTYKLIKFFVLHFG